MKFMTIGLFQKYSVPPVERMDIHPFSETVPPGIPLKLSQIQAPLEFRYPQQREGVCKVCLFYKYIYVDRALSNQLNPLN